MLAVNLRGGEAVAASAVPGLGRCVASGSMRIKKEKIELAAYNLLLVYPAIREGKERKKMRS